FNLNMTEEIEAALMNLPDTATLLKEPKHLEALVPLLFPSLCIKGQMGFFTAPFSYSFLFLTPTLKDLFTNDNWLINIDSKNISDQTALKDSFFDVTSLILNRLYNENINIDYEETIQVKHAETGLTKYYKIISKFDFVEVKTSSPIKKLTKKQIHEILNNWQNTSLTEKYIPIKNFSFEGFVIGNAVDVTKREILSALESLMVTNESNIDYNEGLLYLQQLTRSFLEMPEIEFGSTYIQETAWQNSTDWTLLRRFDSNLLFPALSNKDCAYGKVIATKQAVIIGDLNQVKNLSQLELELREKKYRSLLLIPLFDELGNVLGIMEIGSPLPYRFNQMTVLSLKGFTELYSLGMNSFVKEIDNQVRLTMQQQFTSIHPSVEWKFKEAATIFYWTKTSGKTQSTLPPIIFKDVYPLYGQADIVSSSQLRNKYVTADLIDNLKRVNELMEVCKKQIQFHLLDVYWKRTSTYLNKLIKGEFVSKDETQIIG
ncbi:MAG: GAF domain-containing protein, partial [Bacteroidota bacterium]